MLEDPQRSESQVTRGHRGHVWPAGTERQPCSWAAQIWSDWMPAAAGENTSPLLWYSTKMLRKVVLIKPKVVNYWSLHKANLKSCRSDTMQQSASILCNFNAYIQQTPQLMCCIFIHTATNLYRPDISDTCEQINLEKKQKKMHFSVQLHKNTTDKSC